MKVYKYLEYIKENGDNKQYDTPETYVFNALTILKNKLDKLFEVPVDSDDVVLDSDGFRRVNSDKVKITDLGSLSLASSEISKYSKLNDSLTMKFEDDNYMYNLIIMINIKEGLPKNGESEEDESEDFDESKIENAFIKFKVYDKNTEFQLLGQLSKNVKIKDINEDFLVNLKIEIDEKYGESEGDDEFSIETETNEELKTKTYFSAADELRSLGFYKRSRILRRGAIELFFRELFKGMYIIERGKDLFYFVKNDIVVFSLSYNYSKYVYLTILYDSNVLGDIYSIFNNLRYGNEEVHSFFKNSITDAVRDGSIGIKSDFNEREIIREDVLEMLRGGFHGKLLFSVTIEGWRLDNI